MIAASQYLAPVGSAKGEGRLRVCGVARGEQGDGNVGPGVYRNTECG